MEVDANDVFIVVDVQVDFVNGTMAIADSEKILEPINRTAAKFAHVVVVTDWHPADHISFASSHPGASNWEEVDTPYGKQRVYPAHCVQGTPGAELDPRLDLTKAELILRKGYRTHVDSYGAFYENDRTTATGLGAYLKARGIKRVFCDGLAKFGCVMQTSLGAARDGFEVYMVEDASAGNSGDTPENRAALAEAGVGMIQSDALTA